MTTDLVPVAPTATAPISSANEMHDALRAVQAAIAPDLNAAELKLFAMVAYRSGLDPFARQIHAVKRQGKVSFQTGIDGFRSSAERTREYDGSDEPEYGPACSCGEAPQGHPEWARVTVYRIRNGQRRPQSATAYWHEYKPAPGSSGNADAMWKKMPRLMLAKCAEALALRKAFPYVLADIYSPEEMAQADNGPRVIEHRPSARQLVAERRAALDGDGAASSPTAAGATEASADPPTEASAAAEPDVTEGAFVEQADLALDAEPVAEQVEQVAETDGEAAGPAGLTNNELMRLIGSTDGVTTRMVAATAKELFPDAARLSDLDDAQRLELWDVLKQRIAGPATE